MSFFDSGFGLILDAQVVEPARVSWEVSLNLRRSHLQMRGEVLPGKIQREVEVACLEEGCNHTFLERRCVWEMRVH